MPLSRHHHIDENGASGR